MDNRKFSPSDGQDFLWFGGQSISNPADTHEAEQRAKGATCGLVRLSLPSSPGIIPGVANYLSAMAGGINANRHFVELALDEALSNAMYHGNLEVSSLVKSGDFHGYYMLAINRSQMEPFASRKVEVEARLTEGSIEYVITDEGKGFDWRQFIISTPDPAALYGRGLYIIQSVASCLFFNEQGNRIAITFRK